MRTFFDTSVLVSACQRTHIHHSPGLNAFVSANKDTATCGVHSLAEVYAVITRMPGEYSVAPEDAWLFIRQINERCSLIALKPSEYLATLNATIQSRRPGGIIYDALLLACARKANADRLLTWNVKHFKSLAPDLADRIATP